MIEIVRLVGEADDDVSERGFAGQLRIEHHPELRPAIEYSSAIISLKFVNAGSEN